MFAARYEGAFLGSKLLQRALPALGSWMFWSFRLWDKVHFFADSIHKSIAKYCILSLLLPFSYINMCQPHGRFAGTRPRL
jgi:hypothetical protein